MKKFSRIPFLISIFVAVLALAACGPLPAGAEIDINPDGQSAEVEFIGTVESIASDQWVVSGQFIQVNAQTVIEDNPAVGENVQVHAMVDAGGTVTAFRIESQSQEQVQSINGQSAFEFTGIVESIAANIWTVSGTTFSLTSQTEVKGNILVGDTVKVAYVTNSDGSFSALEIQPTEALAGNNFQFENQDKQEFELYGLVESIAADSWVVSGQTFAVNAQTEIKGAPAVGDFVKVHLYDDNGTYTAREIALADAESQALGAHLEFSGVVDAIVAGSITVNGLTFTITDATEIKGAIATGDTVKVEASIAEDGTLTALEVTKMGGNTIGGGSNGSSGSSSSTGVTSSQGSSYSDDDHGSSSSYKSEDDDDHGSSSSSSSESSESSSSSGEDEDHGSSSSSDD